MTPASPITPYLPLIAAIFAGVVACSIALIQIKTKERQDARDWYYQYFIFEGVERLIVFVKTLQVCLFNLQNNLPIEVPAAPWEAAQRVGDLLRTPYVSALISTNRATLETTVAMVAGLRGEPKPANPMRDVRRDFEKALCEIEDVLDRAQAERARRAENDSRKMMAESSTEDDGNPMGIVRDIARRIVDLEKQQGVIFSDQHAALQRLDLILERTREVLECFEVRRKYDIRHIRKHSRVQALAKDFQDCFKKQVEASAQLPEPLHRDGASAIE